MTKNEKTFLVIAGGLAVLGVGIGVAYAMKKKDALAPAANGAVQGAIEGGLKTESAPVETTVPDQVQPQPQPQPQPKPNPPPQVVQVPNLQQFV